MAEVTIILKDAEDSVDVNVEWGGQVKDFESATPAQKMGAILFSFIDRVQEAADEAEGADDDQPEAA